VSERREVLNAPGEGGPDEVIPRAPARGWRPVRALAIDLGGSGNPAFNERVREAKHLLRLGMPEAEIRERHGGVVLRTAKEEIACQ